MCIPPISEYLVFLVVRLTASTWPRHTGNAKLSRSGGVHITRVHLNSVLMPSQTGRDCDSLAVVVEEGGSGEDAARDGAGQGGGQ